MRNLFLPAMLLAVVFVLPGLCDSGVLSAQDFQDLEKQFEDLEKQLSGPDAEKAAAGILTCCAAFLMIFLIGMLIAIAIAIVILLLLYGCLAKVPAEYREMEPGLVWLMLIPLFNLVWGFFVFTRIPKSYQKYFAAQGRTEFGDCGEQVGLWYAICVVSSFVGSFIPVLGGIIALVAGIAGLVLLIIFLVKVLGLKSQVQGPVQGQMQ